MLLLSYRRSWGLLRLLLLLLLLLLLNGLVLRLTLPTLVLLLNCIHHSLGIERILLGLCNRVTFHGGVVESSVLTLSLVFVIHVLSSTSLSVSHCRHVLSNLGSLTGFAHLLLDLLILQFSIRNHLRPIKELLISSKLCIFRNGILSLQNLIDLSRC